MNKLHWMTEIGALAIFAAMAMAIMVFILPAFEGRRSLGFWAVILPLAVIGASFILIRHRRHVRLQHRR